MTGHWRTFDPYRLTPREAEVATLHAQGLKTKEIAVQLGIKPTSVEHLLDLVREKQE